MRGVEFLSMNTLYREAFLLEEGWYDFWNMFLLLEGSFCVDDDVTVQPGEAVVFAPQKTFHRRVLSPVRFLSIHFAPGGLERVLRALPYGKLCFLDKKRTLSTASLLQAAADDSMPDKELCSHFLADLFCQHLAEQSGAGGRLPHAACLPVARVLQYIEQNGLGEINFSRLSAQLHISHAQLINLFKRETGKTPALYLIGERVKKAKTLLLDSDWKLEQIAQACGFANAYYFSTIFKKHTGLSPSLFRKMYKA